MENRFDWQKLLLRISSYVLVAALASAMTIWIFGLQPTKLNKIQNLIEQRFIGQADMAAAQDAAADAMVNALGDRWSYYVSTTEYEAHQQSKENSYVGIGVTVTAREDGTGIEVIQLEPDGPAKEAGILPGDVIIAVDGQSIANMTVAEASNLIGGKEGTEVSLTLLRNGEQLVLSVERRKILSQIVTTQMLPGQIGYLRLKNFNDRSAEETIGGIEALLEQGAQKLILDMRYNPGGYVLEMVEVLDYLLPEGVLFRSVNYRGTESVEESDEACLEMPMVVMVNGGSYSAAEFFAAALREYEWATVVGEKTTGKGYFQNTFDLGDGSALGLSVGKYFTPNGVSLAETGGLVPDVEVPVEQETASLIYSQLLDPAEDPQVLAAMEQLTGN